jgi:hypothetical protein
MKIIPEHLDIDYSKQPPLMFCKRCGKTRELHLPASIPDVTTQIKAFVESHKDCKEKK